MMNDYDVVILHKAARLVEIERDRQISPEGGYTGYSAAHDDGHTEGQLALLAAAYALSSLKGPNTATYPTPLPIQYLKGVLDAYGWSFKPAYPIRDLVRAGALILAEIERRLRGEAKKG